MGESWYRWFPGDYGRDTRHLSLTEDGAYRRLLDYYYSSGKPLPESLEALSRIAGAQNKTERVAVELVAKEFFPVHDDGMRHNSRADRELRELAAFVANQARKGKLSAEAKRQQRFNHGSTAVEPRFNQSSTAVEPRLTSGSTESPTGDQPELNPTTTTTTTTERTTTTTSPKGAPPGGQKRPPGEVYTEGFLRFWTAYPRKIGKLDAWKAWRTLNGTRPHIDELLRSIEAQAGSDQWRRDGGKFIPHPGTWLRQGRWEDVPQTVVDASDGRPEIDADTMKKFLAGELE